MPKRNSPFWMSTNSGRRFYPLDLRPEDINMEDIAHGLANMCRYNGQCNAFYSVAEHSVRCSVRADDRPVLAYEMLLHDAAEAYVGDMVKPIAEVLRDYRDVRDRIQSFINVHFGLPAQMTSEAHEIDARMLVTEGPVMFSHGDRWWEQPQYPAPYADEWITARDRPIRDDSRGNYELTPFRGQFWPPSMAKRLFLERFHTIRQKLHERGVLTRGPCDARA